MRCVPISGKKVFRIEEIWSICKLLLMYWDWPGGKLCRQEVLEQRREMRDCFKNPVDTVDCVKNEYIQIRSFGIILMGVDGSSANAQVQISSITHCRIACPRLTLLGKLSKK